MSLWLGTRPGDWQGDALKIETTADVDELVSYLGRVFERTRRVAVLIPAGELEHDFGRDGFTPGDLVRHLAGIDRYMFVEAVACGKNRYPGHDRSLADGLESVLGYYDRLVGECLQILRGMPPTDFTAKVKTPDGASITAWKWLRAMVEHEAHHRGQLYWMLAQFGVQTPPLYGLTSEQVRTRAE